jgi:hypothetical protein
MNRFQDFIAVAGEILSIILLAVVTMIILSVILIGAAGHI